MASGVDEVWVDLPFLRVSLPPERIPAGSIPVGVSPFNVNTVSLSSLQENIIKFFALLCVYYLKINV